MDLNAQNGSPYWRILLFSIFVLFGLIVLRVWVIEIAVHQGFLSTFQHIINTQLTLLPGDANTVTAGQNYIMFGLKRLCELCMVGLIVYNIIYIFKQERISYG